jgi:hypothetical protein|tara:strand:+ start:170 stop:532 length:363 start_codon:yes stop_codon:yes gene_type:complete
VKPETKFWQDVRKIKSEIRWTRLENLSSLGTPDLLGYNNNGVFFTVELKVTKSNKITISPHQIAFHITHPNNSFILVKALLSKEVKLYEGSRIQDLVACGLKLEPCSLGLESSLKKLASL